jgi:hypothetical protein
MGLGSKNKMNKPDLYIHIGIQKTGSTAIQRMLRENRRQLLRQRYILLTPPKQVLNGLRDAESMDEVTRILVKKWFASHIHRSRVHRRNKTYLISWESFAGDPWRGWTNSGAIATELYNAVADIAAPKIIVYIRSQDDFIESFYTQMVHQGHDIGFSEFLERVSRFEYDYEKMLTSYANVFERSNLRVRRYSKELFVNRNDLLIDFCRNVGIKFDLLSIDDSELPDNPSYSRDSVEIARLANRHLSVESRRGLRRLLQKVSSKPTNKPFSYFSVDQRKEIFDYYYDSNRRVAEEYFGNNESLFSNSIGDETPYLGLDLETAVSILAGMVSVAAQNCTEQSVSPITKFRKAIWHRISLWLRRIGRNLVG